MYKNLKTSSNLTENDIFPDIKKRYEILQVII